MRSYGPDRSRRFQSGGTPGPLIAPTPAEAEGSPVGLSGGQTEVAGSGDIAMAEDRRKRR